MSSRELRLEAIKSMTGTNKNTLFDITIICTSDDEQSRYWTKRLSEGICRNDSEDIFPLVLAVSEDWAKGGAGNGMGTLYAYEKACKTGCEQYGLDVAALLRDKQISVALFHTAGKGTRLAPLPASENNNKSGVKLPVCHELIDGSLVPITVLEAVVKNTGIYAPSRKGRLSVFWGDQIFIPSASFNYTPIHHADIMCTLIGESSPTIEEWEEKGLEKYGVIGVSKNVSRNAVQVEKVDYVTAMKMFKVLGDIGQVGTSLGSFSVSAALITALCQEYSIELMTKRGKFDTDPHFWMPLTLPEEDYITLMCQKNFPSEESKTHHQRMTKMKENFELDGMGLFGAVDVGTNACWWDYGQLKLYSSNNLKFLEDDENSHLLHKFFGVTSNTMGSTLGEDLKMDESSKIFACKIKSGNISNSVIAAVESPNVALSGSIVINCTAKKIIAGNKSILYNLIDDSDKGIIAGDGDILVGVMDNDGAIMELRSKISVCGGKNWKTIVDGNQMTFEEVMCNNFDANISVIDCKRKELFKKVSSSFAISN